MSNDVDIVGTDPLHDIPNKKNGEHSLDALRYAFIKMQSDWDFF